MILNNIEDGERVHQRCILIHGRVPAHKGLDDSVSIFTEDPAGQTLFPQQQWPLSHGHFRALLFLNTGTNHVRIEATNETQNLHDKISIKLDYIPLLQVPPLHLAILIAKDSPLRIDCPPSKYGSISTTHSSIEAAIAKFRLTAYMWQALTAEDLRAKGLGRRSFRFDEEWGVDTISKAHDDAIYENLPHKAMNSTAKIHLVPTAYTVAELRDAERAQQNRNARDREAMHRIFSQALEDQGGVFASNARPVVAGLILDSHYSVEQDLILAHAALGSHNPKGLSLGIFGSHLTFAWPRYVEEIPACLLDTTPPGNTVGNDNGECVSMWKACAVGQGAFLHEVGHAFSAPHSSGIMTRGYSPDWPLPFLSRTLVPIANGQAENHCPVTPVTKHECRWDIRDALRFVNLPHFRQPGDHVPASKQNCSVPYVIREEIEGISQIKVSAEAGIAQVRLNGELQAVATISNPKFDLLFTCTELESRFDRNQRLEMEVLGMNGKHRVFDVWKTFNDRNFIGIPGTDIKLLKQCAGEKIDESHLDDTWTWAVMLKKLGVDGKLVNASKIDVRVGLYLDGAVIHYEDGTRMNCGPRVNKDGSDFKMGGHLSEEIALPPAAEIVKVQASYSNGVLFGLRMYLSTGDAVGVLNRVPDDDDVIDLVPSLGHKIIGFYGINGRDSICFEFGIVTAPRAAILPDKVWEMQELTNKDGEPGAQTSFNSCRHTSPNSTTSDMFALQSKAS